MGLTSSDDAGVLDPSQADGRAPGAQAEPPERPLIVIERSRLVGALDLRELWAYRELLYFLTWRDVKLRYKQTALGAAWVVVQPLAQMLIFTVLFGRLAGFGELTGGIPYPLFAFAGLIPWTFFSTAASSSGNSLVGSAHLITKVYFPRLLLPAGAVAAALVDLAISLLVLAALMAYYGVRPGWGLLAVPLLVALTGMLALAVGMLLSAANVRWRDVRAALPFVMQVWMFASPVVYPSSLLPESWRWALALNPMTGVIEAFRAALFGRALDGPALAVSAGTILALLIFSTVAFRRMERTFADVI